MIIEVIVVLFIHVNWNLSLPTILWLQLFLSLKFFALAHLIDMNIFLGCIYFIKKIENAFFKKNHQNIIFLIECLSFIAKTTF